MNKCNICHDAFCTEDRVGGFTVGYLCPNCLGVLNSLGRFREDSKTLKDRASRLLGYIIAVDDEVRSRAKRTQ
jgi:hypothetical protein